MEELIKKFREKLEAGGHSLKWWHKTYLVNSVTGKPIYKYNYFIRQINQPDSMQEDLAQAMRDYLTVPA